MNNRSLLSNPLVLGLAGLIAGLLIGWLLLGYVLFPLQYTNADAWDLNPAAKANWVVMTADSYSISQDLTTARERLRGFTPDSVTQILKAAVVERNTKGDGPGAARLQAFGQVAGYNLSSTGAAARPTAAQGGAGGAGSILDSLGTLLLALAVIILLIAAGLYLYMRSKSGPAQPQMGRPTPAMAPAGMPYSTGETADYTPAAPIPVREEPVRAPAAPSQTTRTTAPASRSLGTFAATYKFGEDNYDTSYTLETARGEFLGETGMGTSEKVDDTKPDKVAAFDIWLFDKTDVRTVTQILMSENAFNDQTMRQKLATKGELVLAEKGKRLRLETATLAVDAEIMDLVYASTPGLPPNSHFQKLIVEMIPVQK